MASVTLKATLSLSTGVCVRWLSIDRIYRGCSVDGCASTGLLVRWLSIDLSHRGFSVEGSASTEPTLRLVYTAGMTLKANSRLSI